MAIFHLHVSHGSRVGGQSAADGAAYAVRHGEHAARDDLAFAEAGNLPAWAHGDPRAFWAGIDELSRSNGRLYTEIESALPTELSLEQNLELIRGYVATITNRPDGRVPFEFGIHYKDGNPHVHCVFSARVDDGLERDRETWFKRAAKSPKLPTQGGAHSWSEETDKAWIKSVRATWADHVNGALERAGSVERIDHRSHADRALIDLPTVHEGIDGRQSLRARAHNDAVREINKLNAELAGVKKELEAAGITRDDYREFRKQHPSDATKLRNERRDRNEAATARVADAANKQKAQEQLVEDTQQQRTAKMLHVSLDQVDAALRLIKPQSAEARAALPGIVGGRAFENPGSIHHLRPRFVSKSIADGQVQLHLKMPDDTLVFVERQLSIRLRDGYDRETVAAALQVGASRWETMVLTGPPEFKHMALEEARRLGILDRVEIPPEFSNEFMKPPTQEAAAAKVLQPKAGKSLAEGSKMSMSNDDKDKLDFLNVEPASARPVDTPPVATGSDPIPDPTLSEHEKAKRELEVALRKRTFAELLDLRSESISDLVLSAEMLEKLVALLLRLASLGFYKFDTKISDELSARRHLAKMAAKEIDMRRQALADPATRRTVFEEHAKAVRKRVAELERRSSIARASLESAQGMAATAEAAALLRKQWREGFDRLQVSRKQATIADREATVLAAKKKVELIKATVVPPVGFFGGKAKQEAHDAAAAGKAARLGRAELVRDDAQAALDAGWSEIDAKLELNRQAKAAVEKAAVVELTQLRAQIESFPKESVTIRAAVHHERIAAVRNEALADAANPVTDDELAAAAERLRIRRLADGHAPG